MRGTRPRLGAAAIGAVLLLGAASVYPLPPRSQEDLAGARNLPPLTRAHSLALRDQRVWIVTGLRSEPGEWRGRRAGAAVRLEAASVLGAPRPRLYVLGTDALGRDLASRLLHGVRRSLLIAAAALFVALALGVGVGFAAALGGRRVDGVLMRGVDVLMAVPRLLLFLLLVTLVPPSAPILVLVLGAVTWPGLARLVRAETLRLRETEAVRAARAAGCSTLRLALRHLAPQLGAVIAVTATLRFADTIVLESALGFLGIGPAAAPSLGGIIAAGRDQIGQAWWAVVFPVATLTALVLAVRAGIGRALARPDPASLT